MAHYVDIWILITSFIIWTQPYTSYRLRSRLHSNGTAPTPSHVYIYDRSQRLLDEAHHLCRKPGRQCLDESRLQICTGLLRPKILIYCNLKGNGRPYCNNVEQGCSAQRSPMTDDEFICPRAGFYPDPYNCQSYYECNKIDGIGVLFSCADSKVFNFDKKTCLPIRDLRQPCKIIDCRRKWRKLIRYQRRTSLYGYCDPNSARMRLFECHKESRLGSKCTFNSTTNEFELRPEVLVTLNPPSSTELTHEQNNKSNKIHRGNKTTSNNTYEKEFTFESQIERNRFKEMDNQNNNFEITSAMESTESIKEENIITLDVTGVSIRKNKTKDTTLPKDHILTEHNRHEIEFMTNTDANSEIAQHEKLSSVIDFTYTYGHTNTNVTEITNINNSFVNANENYFYEFENNTKIIPANWRYNLTNIDTNNSSVTQEVEKSQTYSSLRPSPGFFNLTTGDINLDITNEKDVTSTTEQTAEKTIAFPTDDTTVNYEENETEQNNDTGLADEFDQSNTTLYNNRTTRKTDSSIRNNKQLERLATITNDESIAHSSFDKLLSANIHESSSTALSDNYEQSTNVITNAEIYENTNLTAIDIAKKNVSGIKILDGKEYMPGSINEESPFIVKVFISEPSDSDEHSSTFETMNKYHSTQPSETVKETAAGDTIHNFSTHIPSNSNEQPVMITTSNSSDISIIVETHDYTIATHGKAVKQSSTTEKMYYDTTLSHFNTESYLPNGVDEAEENATNSSNTKESSLISQKMSEINASISPNFQELSPTNIKTNEYTTLAPGIMGENLSMPVTTSGKMYHTSSTQPSKSASETHRALDNAQPSHTTVKMRLTDVEEQSPLNVKGHGNITILPTDTDERSSTPVKISDFHNTGLMDVEVQSTLNVENQDHITVLPTDERSSTTVKISDFHNSGLTNVEEQSSLNVKKQDHITVLPTDTDERSSSTMKISDFHNSGPTDVEEQSTLNVKKQDHITVLPTDERSSTTIDHDERSSTTVKISDFHNSGLTNVEAQSTLYVENQDDISVLLTDTDERSTTTVEMKDYHTSEFTDVGKLLTSDKLHENVSELSFIEKQLPNSVIIQEYSTEGGTSSGMAISGYPASVGSDIGVLGTDVALNSIETSKTEVHHMIDYKSNEETTASNYGGTGERGDSSQDLGSLNSSSYYNLNKNKTYAPFSQAENKTKLVNIVSLNTEKVIGASSGCVSFIHISGTFRNFDHHFVII